MNELKLFRLKNIVPQCQQGMFQILVKATQRELFELDRFL